MGAISDVSIPFQLQRRDMRLTHDLMGGTMAMRRAGVVYIPKKHGESDEDYDARINRTVLLNAYKRTLRFSRGQVFKRPVVIEDTTGDNGISQEIVSWFQQWSEDVDCNGSSLTDWGGDVFEAGLNDGVTFCLVDYPSVPLQVNDDGYTSYIDENGVERPKSAEIDRKQALDPYLVHVKAEQVLDARMDKVDGKFRITTFRYIENYDIPKDEWTIERRQRIRVFTPGHYAIWENNEDGSAAFEIKSEGDMRDENGQLLSYVPVCIFMPGDKRTDVTAEPALIDLADLNRRHWQAYCAQCELMEYARFPVWFGRQLTDEKDKPFGFGPGILINASSDYSSLDSKGVDAASVEAGRLELADLESKMSMYGLQLLQPDANISVTATEVNQDTEESVSSLEDWAMRFQNFLENCLVMVSMWNGWEDAPGVKVNTEIARVVNVSILLDLEQRGAISKRTLLSQFKRAGILPDDFYPDEEIDLVSQELSTTRGPSGSIDLKSFINNSGNNQKVEI